MKPEGAAADHAALVAYVRARHQRNAARSQRIADRKAAAERVKVQARTSAAKLFERSKEWRELSQRARRLQPWCSRCGGTDQLQGDHILPKSKHPSLALDPTNIQVLCWPCNRAKGRK